MKITANFSHIPIPCGNHCNDTEKPNIQFNIHRTPCCIYIKICWFLSFFTFECWFVCLFSMWYLLQKYGIDEKDGRRASERASKSERERKCVCMCVCEWAQFLRIQQKISQNFDGLTMHFHWFFFLSFSEWQQFSLFSLHTLQFLLWHSVHWNIN